MSIYKKQSENPKEFETAEEFLKYYDNNRKDIDATHTRSLNLKYKIKDHSIGRKQGKLILYPQHKNISEPTARSSTEINEEDLNAQYEQLKNALLDLNERVKKLESISQTNFPLCYHK